MKIKTLYKQHYKKCKRTKTNIEQAIKSLSKIKAVHENKKYRHAEVYVWNNCSVAFLFTDRGRDIITFGKDEDVDKRMEEILDPYDYQRCKAYFYHKRAMQRYLIRRYLYENQSYLQTALQEMQKSENCNRETDQEGCKSNGIR